MCLSTFHWKTQTFSLASSMMQIDMIHCGVLRTALAKTRGGTWDVMGDSIISLPHRDVSDKRICYKKWLPWGCLGVLNNTGAMNLQQVVQFKLIGFTLFDIKCSLFMTDF